MSNVCDQHAMIEKQIETLEKQQNKCFSEIGKRTKNFVVVLLVSIIGAIIGVTWNSIQKVDLSVQVIKEKVITQGERQQAILKTLNKIERKIP